MTINLFIIDLNHLRSYIKKIICLGPYNLISSAIINFKLIAATQRRTATYSINTKLIFFQTNSSFLKTIIEEVTGNITGDRSLLTMHQLMMHRHKQGSSNMILNYFSNVKIFPIFDIVVVQIIFIVRTTIGTTRTTSTTTIIATRFFFLSFTIIGSCIRIRSLRIVCFSLLRIHLILKLIQTSTQFFGDAAKTINNTGKCIRTEIFNIFLHILHKLLIILILSVFIIIHMIDKLQNRIRQSILFFFSICFLSSFLLLSNLLLSFLSFLIRINESMSSNEFSANLLCYHVQPLVHITSSAAINNRINDIIDTIKQHAQ